MYNISYLCKYMHIQSSRHASLTAINNSTTITFPIVCIVKLVHISTHSKFQKNIPIVFPLFNFLFGYVKKGGLHILTHSCAQTSLSIFQNVTILHFFCWNITSFVWQYVKEGGGSTNHSRIRRKKWQGKWVSPGTHTVSSGIKKESIRTAK